jgi:hypothetical protein
MHHEKKSSMAKVLLRPDGTQTREAFTPEAARKLAQFPSKTGAQSNNGLGVGQECRGRAVPR